MPQEKGLPRDEVLRGLTLKEAKERLGEYGLNVLPERPPPSSFAIFLSQFKNPLVYVLFAAAIVTFFLRDYSDMVIILLVVFVNSILGFVQEQKANRALEALKAMVHPKADVIRDGKKVRIDIEEIVPGDMVELESGDKIPADGKLIIANRLFIEEAILTGESIPVEKQVSGQVFMGTIVSSGQGLMEVVATGAKSEIGKIAASVQKPHEETPLTKQLKVFSNQLTILVIILTAFVFVVGMITGKELVEIFKTSVALAVSSIPEGLLIALTVVLAVGMQRILRKKGLVRNLVSAETLGGVTTICVDKTGTLTQGKLKVVEEYGDNEKVCIQHFASADDPIMVAARNWLKGHTEHFEELGEKFRQDCRVIDFIPFSPQNRFYATLIEHNDNNKEIYVNGAPEHLLSWSTLSKGQQGEIKKKIKTLTIEGKRIIGMAKKDVPETFEKISEKDVRGGLFWVGLLVYTDPVRKGVGEAFEKATKAGIRTIVITGDYAETALAVMREIGMDIDEDRVIKGSELEKLSEGEVSAKLKKLYESGRGAILFARTRPEQKLKVISALKANKEVVAMMGDGVNDAPALRRSDIGIVVGEATDVAKETADLVLLDSNFATIIAAIEEGRGIFDNIRKIILYLMSDAFSEIIAVVGTIILRFPLPVTAVQILWINLVSDGFPHLALTVDPKSPGIMREKPRSPKENIVMPWMKILIGIVSLYSGLSALLVFIFILNTQNNEILARSVAFLILGINSLVYVFSVRTLKEPFWKSNPLDNRWLILAVFAGFALQLFPFITSVGREFFNVSILPVNYWTLVFIISFVMFIMIEISKHFLKGKLFNQQK